MEFPDVVNLNVGGRYFTTCLSTLTKYPDSKLAAMFNDRYHMTKDKDGYFFIDVDGDLFPFILNFLRCKKTPSPEKALEVIQYAEYFGLENNLKTAMSEYMPVRAIALYERVRQNMPGYADTLKQIKANLLTEDISSLTVFILAHRGQQCCERKDADAKELIRGEHKNYFLKGHTGFQFTLPDTSLHRMMTVLTVLVHDLAVFGAKAEDEIIYKPFPGCQCTVGRKIRIIV